MRDDEDPTHYEYMVSLRSAAIIPGLVEDALGWSFSGPLRIRKDRAVYDDPPAIRPLHPGSRFYKVPFRAPHPDDANKQVLGVALWFEKTPKDPPVIGESITLCGWVPAAREAQLDEWITFMNELIAQRLAAAPAEPADHQMQVSLAGLEALGVNVPEGETVDEVMHSLEVLAKEPR